MSPEHDSGLENLQSNTTAGGEMQDFTLHGTTVQSTEMELVTHSTHEHLQSTFFATLDPSQSAQLNQSLSMSKENGTIEHKNITYTDTVTMRVNGTPERNSLGEPSMITAKLGASWTEYKNSPEGRTDPVDCPVGDNHTDSIAMALVWSEVTHSPCSVKTEEIIQLCQNEELSTQIVMIFCYHMYVLRGLMDEKPDEILRLAENVLHKRDIYDEITVSFAERLYCALSDNVISILDSLEYQKSTSESYQLGLRVSALNSLPASFAIELGQYLLDASRRRNVPEHSIVTAKLQCIHKLRKCAVEENSTENSPGEDPLAWSGVGIETGHQGNVSHSQKPENPHAREMINLVHELIRDIPASYPLEIIRGKIEEYFLFIATDGDRIKLQILIDEIMTYVTKVDSSHPEYFFIQSLKEALENESQRM